jgi:hypothetical protein
LTSPSIGERRHVVVRQMEMLPCLEVGDGMRGVDHRSW